jgi:Heterokaryon incompatibility protein (HET)
VAAVVLRRPPPGPIIGPYQYLPGPEWICLCKVHDDGDGGLYLRLEKFRLRDAPPYNAPSYTWRPAEGVPEDCDATALNLTVNGQDHPITKNLTRALLYLRDINSTRYYWIDAICINQLDDVERSSQVNVIYQICQKAETGYLAGQCSCRDSEDRNSPSGTR